MWRKITALVLAFTLLWGNTGFSVNLHYCSSEHALYFVFYDSWGNACESEISADSQSSCGKSKTSSCCEVMASKLPAPSAGCCSDNEITLKINDAFSQAPRMESLLAPSAVIIPTFFHVSNFGLSQPDWAVSISEIPPGVPLANRLLHVFISVFRI